MNKPRVCNDTGLIHFGNIGILLKLLIHHNFLRFS